MKKLLLILTFVLFSFSASANDGTVEDYYKFCKPYQANGFSPEGLTSIQKTKSLLCHNSLVNLMKRGQLNCVILNKLRKNNEINDDQFLRLSSLIANEFVRPNPLITTFLNYAENNPDHWEAHISESTFYFLNKKYPCKYKK